MLVQAESITCEEQRPKNGLSREQPDVTCGPWPVPCPLELRNVSYTQKILKICLTSLGIDGETEVWRGAGIPTVLLWQLIQSPGFLTPFGEFLLSSTKFFTLCQALCRPWGHSPCPPGLHSWEQDRHRVKQVKQP